MTQSRMSSGKRRVYTLAAVVAAVAMIVPAAAWAADRFTDVPDSNIFHDDIGWLADAGVTRGCNPPTNDEFCPRDLVNRETMAAFMHRLAVNRVVDAGTLEGMTAAELVASVGGLSPWDECQMPGATWGRWEIDDTWLLSQTWSTNAPPVVPDIAVGGPWKYGGVQEFVLYDLDGEVAPVKVYIEAGSDSVLLDWPEGAGLWRIPVPDGATHVTACGIGNVATPKIFVSDDTLEWVNLVRCDAGTAKIGWHVSGIPPHHPEATITLKQDGGTEDDWVAVGVFQVDSHATADGEFSVPSDFDWSVGAWLEVENYSEQTGTSATFTDPCAE